MKIYIVGNDGSRLDPCVESEVEEHTVFTCDNGKSKHELMLLVTTDGYQLNHKTDNYKVPLGTRSIVVDSQNSDVHFFYSNELLPTLPQKNSRPLFTPRIRLSLFGGYGELSASYHPFPLNADLDRATGYDNRHYGVVPGVNVGVMLLLADVFGAGFPKSLSGNSSGLILEPLSLVLSSKGVFQVSPVFIDLEVSLFAITPSIVSIGSRYLSCQLSGFYKILDSVAVGVNYGFTNLNSQNGDNNQTASVHFFGLSVMFHNFDAKKSWLPQLTTDK